ncbi:hypothetical protein I3271_07465 [Photobacterium leiognathi]|uniref:ProQ/FINO family protein n=1 Tax=Photobacterium leiognathi TaxID=553611 RepID=UPI001EDD94C8|nr:ProQ/FINO family protein [Photobacterium leiognathi]MCG3884524.1 hypothetical protein [Photobacterium leiognathi]
MCNKDKSQRYEEAAQFVYNELKDLKAPFAKGIAAELMARMKGKGHSYHAIRFGIHRWLNSFPYLLSTINGKSRYNLDGSEAGPISEEDKVHAKKVVNEKRKKQRERSEPRELEQSKEQTFHIHYTVEHLLSLNDEDLCDCVTHPDGVDAARSILKDMLSRGITCHVISVECDQKLSNGSCAGHPYES